MYERKQPIGEKIQFAIPSAHDLDETQLDETCPNCAGDHDENQVDENSDGSDSWMIDDEIENDLTFLRTTRSGRSITINRSLFKSNDLVPPKDKVDQAKQDGLGKR